MKAFRNREALLPALFVWRLGNDYSSFFDYITKQVNELEKIYRANSSVASALPNKTILSINLLSNKDEVMIADLRHPVTDYVRIRGRKLRQNEVAIVGYADGTHEFKLNELDRAVAHNLSHEQLDCLVDLYQAQDASWLVKLKRYENILRSLPLNMRVKIGFNYKIPFGLFMNEFLSDAYRAYAGVVQDTEEARREKAIIEQQQKKIKDEISREKWDHEYEMEKEKANAKRLQDERNNRPFWKRHGHVMLVAVGAFAVGWMGKSYWGPISSAAVSWFKGLKVKLGYR